MPIINIAGNVMFINTPNNVPATVPGPTKNPILVLINYLLYLTCWIKFPKLAPNTQANITIVLYFGIKWKHSVRNGSIIPPPPNPPELDNPPQIAMHIIPIILYNYKGKIA